MTRSGDWPPFSPEILEGVAKFNDGMQAFVDEVTRAAMRITQIAAAGAARARASRRLAPHRRIDPERLGEDAYRLRIARERAIGRGYVNQLLDDMCREYGWDPAEVWRRPRREDPIFIHRPTPWKD